MIKISSSTQHTLWKITWLVLGVGFFLLFAHRAWFIAETDYIAYYNAGLRAAQGGPLYVNEQTPFKYLPVVSYFFVPLAWLPFQVSRFCFFLLSFVAGVGVYLRVHRASGHWITLAALGAMIRFHNYDFLNAQVNHLLLALLMGYLSLRQRRGALASFLFALLASFKLVPLLLLAPLFLMRRFREVGGIIVWFCILSLVPAFFFKEGFLIYQSWFELLRATTEFPAPASEILQSVQAALWFWTGSTSLSTAVQLGLIGVCCAAALRAKAEQDQEAVILSGMILSVVLSPLAWKHNYLLLLPVTVQLLRQRRYRDVSIAFVLMTGVTAVVRPFSAYWADRSYALLLGALFLFAVLVARVFSRASTD